MPPKAKTKPAAASSSHPPIFRDLNIVYLKSFGSYQMKLIEQWGGTVSTAFSPTTTHCVCYDYDLNAASTKLTIPPEVLNSRDGYDEININGGIKIPKNIQFVKSSFIADSIRHTHLEDESKHHPRFIHQARRQLKLTGTNKNKNKNIDVSTANAAAAAGEVEEEMPRVLPPPSPSDSGDTIPFNEQQLKKMSRPSITPVQNPSRPVGVMDSTPINDALLNNHNELPSQHLIDVQNQQQQEQQNEDAAAADDDDDASEVVIVRRGSEFIAVKGHIPQFTGGHTGIPWGEYNVFLEPFNVDTARDTLNKVRDFWYATSSGERGGGEALLSPSPSNRATSKLNGVCLHIVCSKRPFCIIKKLGEYKSIYTNSKEYFKKRAIDKAMSELAKHPAPLQTAADVDTVQGLGKKSGEKVKELLSTGEAKRIKEMAGNERLQAIQSLTDIWGVGEATAQSWYRNYDITNPSQVKECVDQGSIKLTETQQCGLKYVEEFKRKIPRDEVARAESAVRDAVFDLVEEMYTDSSSGSGGKERMTAYQVAKTYAFATGSYGRGAAECSDIDMLIILPVELNHIDCGLFLSQLKRCLYQKGLLLNEMSPLAPPSSKVVATTTDTPTTSSGVVINRASWLGVARPPNSPCARRIDFKLYGNQHLPFAVNYFSNSQGFCRATRHWATHAPSSVVAARKLHPRATGFKLSELTMECRHSSSPSSSSSVAARKRKRKSSGGGTAAAAAADDDDEEDGGEEELGVGPEIYNETDLFQVLGLHYVPPTMRNFTTE
jgi:DNA polymerase/3'-5' exonuclease PolX